MDTTYEIQFMKALLFTVSIETAALLLISKFLFKTEMQSISKLNLIFVGVLCSFATLPYVWFVFPAFFHQTTIYILCVETFAFVVEAFIYYFALKLSIEKSFIVSLICNAVSFFTGLNFFN